MVSSQTGSSTSRARVSDRLAPAEPSAPTAPTARSRGWLEGWSLTLVATISVAAIVAGIVVAGSAGAEAIELAIRTTARTSFALFLAAFTASALHRLWPSRITKWQRRNRRYLGVGFAASHLIHAATIIALVVMYPAAFATAAPALIPGLVGYVLLLAMTATSFDRTAGWIGPRAWKVLHTVGSLYLWGAFFQAFLRRALHMPAYWVAVALAVGAIALRVIAWQRGRRAAANGR
jgi:sulfoxide reductase heme-binding subunit YedZ